MSGAALAEEKRSQREHAAAAHREPHEGGRDQYGDDEKWMHADSQSDGPASRYAGIAGETKILDVLFRHSAK